MKSFFLLVLLSCAVVLAFPDVSTGPGFGRAQQMKEMEDYYADLFEKQMKKQNKPEPERPREKLKDPFHVTDVGFQKSHLSSQKRAVLLTGCLVADRASP